jgi:hypothetical protein
VVANPLGEGVKIFQGGDVLLLFNPRWDALKKEVTSLV